MEYWKSGMSKIPTVGDERVKAWKVRMSKILLVGDGTPIHKKVKE
jgi:hypothetical protein